MKKRLIADYIDNDDYELSVRVFLRYGFSDNLKGEWQIIKLNDNEIKAVNYWLYYKNGKYLGPIDVYMTIDKNGEIQNITSDINKLAETDAGIDIASEGHYPPVTNKTELKKILNKKWRKISNKIIEEYYNNHYVEEIAEAIQKYLKAK